MVRTRHPLDTGNSARLNVLVNKILALGTFQTNSTQDFTDNKCNTGTYIQNPFFLWNFVNISRIYAYVHLLFFTEGSVYFSNKFAPSEKRYILQVVTLFIRKRKLIIRTDKPARLRYKQKTSGRDFVFDNWLNEVGN